MALAWVLNRGGDDVVPIPGAKRIARLEENVTALQIEFEAGHLDTLDSLAGQVAGDHYNPAGMSTVNH
ncbi:hypothetical protein ABZ860_27485 [Microbispora sp. NPDC046973]|uniref:hypothetical protein n=1 Tax=Microbispora sp. NPDC046973 TaxID=3155022 RepID=UPI0033FA3D01